jgi:hypothetical protein
MTDTRRKLDEALYFLEELKINIEDDRIFSFNLSAFVTAARSVTLLMKKEFCHTAEFEDWYVNKQRLIESDNDFKFFNQLRVATVHTSTLRPNKKISMRIVEPGVQIGQRVGTSDSRLLIVRFLQVQKITTNFLLLLTLFLRV